MGLDQKAGWIDSSNPAIETFEVTEFEWRKHSRLQEYMRIAWHKKNKGTEPPTNVMGDEFNCSNVYLTEEDIYALQTLVLNQDLPEAEDGFFWGTEYQEEAMKECKMYDLKFCHDALAWLKEDKTVFYSSWW